MEDHNGEELKHKMDEPRPICHCSPFPYAKAPVKLLKCSRSENVLHWSRRASIPLPRASQARGRGIDALRLQRIQNPTSF